MKTEAIQKGNLVNGCTLGAAFLAAGFRGALVPVAFLAGACKRNLKIRTLQCLLPWRLAVVAQEVQHFPLEKGSCDQDAILGQVSKLGGEITIHAHACSLGCTALDWVGKYLLHGLLLGGRLLQGLAQLVAALHLHKLARG